MDIPRDVASDKEIVLKGLDAFKKQDGLEMNKAEIRILQEWIGDIINTTKSSVVNKEKQGIESDNVNELINNVRCILATKHQKDCYNHLHKLYLINEKLGIIVSNRCGANIEFVKDPNRLDI